MSLVDYILDGLEAELELERELGVRFVECDRTLLKVGPGGDAETLVSTPTPTPAPAPAPTPTPSPSPAPTPTPTPTPAPCSVLFLHNKPLSSAGIEMMAKIITALGMTAETAPILFEKPLPKAKIVVVLGGLALRKFLPTMHGAPGQWLQTPKGTPVLITYSPEYILRFKEVTPAVKKIKADMWRSLKSLLRRM